ncbi:tRNA lysidine(34) synthetase TilS [Paenibacillus septentrionalis]|uniref:tRNA(Ile)-lysidine synthase n=1 Tax=Paenibacillus septentrionalis TaxID=429342 RepID=A0ABW1V904_9BACL
MSIMDELSAALIDEGLLNKPGNIVVAVSGGADSMALLHMLHRLSFQLELKLVAAHVNHGFRKESEAEAELVRSYCMERQIAFEMIELDMPAYLSENAENSQAASRKRRYDFFHYIAEKTGAYAIALAHHADDQAETVLMHMLRGSGLSGISGMQDRRVEKNVELLRPLLRMRKNQLIRLCQEEQVPYLEDSSNQSRNYHRNELRLDIIPVLERYNPQLVFSLSRLAEIAGDEDAWLQQQTEEQFEQLVTKQDNSYVISCRDLCSEPIALQRRLIKLILSYLSQEAAMISFDGIERIRNVASDHAKATYRMDVGEGIVCVREYEGLRFVHIKHYQTSTMTSMPLSISQEQLPCELQYEQWRIIADIIPVAQQPQLQSKYEAVFDADALAFPLYVRSRKSGDRMHVLGLNGSKKVQDMFVDAKIAVAKRDTYPILVDHEGRILWLPGVRRSSYGLVQEQTTSIVFIRMVAM